MRVYLINPQWLHHYRKGVGHRNKSDRADARLLARYAAHERDELRAWTPPPAGQRRLCSLLKRRAKLVQVQTTLEQSFAEEKAVAEAFQRTRAELQRLARAIERRIKALLREHGWWAHYQRCCAIFGVGETTAAALVAAFQRGAFKSADAFVAYLGLDVRRRQSGRYEGQAKLTKQGESEYRRLLHNAARAAARRDLKAYYERLRERGLQPTQAHVAVARKLARIAFSLMKNQTTYDPSKIAAA
ncbi:transposase, partial [Arhodomonas sp. KWT]|uniref:transposase n=1 Tax=Arhodomonas sp. KWT TaxID=2679915 RepID=UPI00210F2D51